MRAILDFGFVVVTPASSSALAAHLLRRGTAATEREAMRQLAEIAELVEALREEENESPESLQNQTNIEP